MNDDKRPLGEWLRQRRETLGFSLEKAETDTRIRIQYLEALEQEDFQNLPNEVVLRGFLRNYASYLGLDPQEAASRYSAFAPPSEPAAVAADKPLPMAEDLFRPVALHRLPSRRWRRGLILGLIVIALVVAAVWVRWNYPELVADLFTGGSSQPTPTQDIKLATATLTPAGAAITTSSATWTPVVSTQTPKSTARPVTPSPFPSPSPSPSPSRPIYTGVFVELNFIEASWVQVTTDGVRQLQDEIEAGVRQAWYGEERVDLRIGNAGGVEVTVNGQNLGTLGGPGEVIDVSFEKVGSEAVMVTPGVTPTVTIEPTILPTTAVPTVQPAVVSPTLTVAPTATITPTVAITPTTSP